MVIKMLLQEVMPPPQKTTKQLTKGAEKLRKFEEKQKAKAQVEEMVGLIIYSYFFKISLKKYLREKLRN